MRHPFEFELSLETFVCSNQTLALIGERWKVHSRDPHLLRDPLWPKSSTVNLNHFLDSSNGYSRQSGWTHLQSSRLLKATSEAHWTLWTETCEVRVQIWNWTHGYQALLSGVDLSSGSIWNLRWRGLFRWYSTIVTSTNFLEMLGLIAVPTAELLLGRIFQTCPRHLLDPRMLHKCLAWRMCHLRGPAAKYGRTAPVKEDKDDQRCKDK